jgi:hypothetical protein
VGATPVDRQVTLSNAYALNRGLTQEQCAAIVRTYRRIRREMPETSAGEWYNCYPPFEKGFRHMDWNYMNGGVSTICAGELAHGAFEHGFERYGVETLRRLLEWAERLGGYLHCCLRGKLPEPEPREFTPVDLRAEADVDLCGAGGGRAVIGWLGEPENDMRNLPTGRQVFEGVEFDVIDPAENDRCAFIGLSHREPYRPSAAIAVGAKAASVYLLHAVDGGGAPVGRFIVHYEDGTHATQYVNVGSEVLGWFMPAPNDPYAGGNKARKPGSVRMAWQGPNGKFENVGVSVYGWDNPHPDRTIERIELEAAETGARWLVGGVTLCDRPARFAESPVSYGIPDMWGAAALVYALIEGLAGIVDTGCAYRSVRLSPRWAAAGVGKATACAKYPASGGYVRYRYEACAGAAALMLDVAGNADGMRLELLLPEGRGAAGAQVDGRAAEVETVWVEQSRYAALRLEGVGVHRVVVELDG